MKVYLAGKIKKNDWRHELFPHLRNYDVFEHNSYPHKIELLMKEDFEYVGPFFLSDDHGSYHGENKHGRGVGMIENPILPDKKPNTAKTVVNKCFEWIDKSDILFVWLDKEDAYGTIVEIGYAKAKKKPIFLVIDQALRQSTFVKDSWFMQTMADDVYFEENAKKGWEKFEARFGTNSKMPFAYIAAKHDRTWINTKISEFANTLARTYSVEELNKLDREELAKQFIEKTPLRYRSFVYFMKDPRLSKDIAEEIDYKIVRGYYKITTNKEAKDLQSWEIKGTGLIYQFEQNYKKEKENNQEKKTASPKTHYSASPNQIKYLADLLKKNSLELTIPVQLLNSSQAKNLISYLVEKTPLEEDDQRLLKEQDPTEFSGTLKASGIVERLKRIFEHEEGMIITMPLHTKCKYYFEDTNVLKENAHDGRYIICNEFGDYEYTKKWLDLLVETLRDKDTYAKLKKYKKGKLKK